jgi:hypothetical protein
VVAFWDMFKMTDEIALTALNYFFAGTAFFIVCYMVLFTDKPFRKMVPDNDKIMQRFVQSHLSLFLTIFFVTALLTILRFFLYRISYSYGYFLPLGIAGGLISIFIPFITLDRKKYGGLKFLLLLLIVYMGALSYNPIIRFSFISWVICVGIIFTGAMKMRQKFLTYIVGGTMALLFFSLAGVSRRTDITRMSVSEIVEASWERSNSSEDANMLDGFMMVLQVYPNMAEYAYGVNHLEIFVRPIPRTWWPNKPVGGWANKLGLNNENIKSNLTIGISESIFGTFYCEGGIVGMAIGCLAYALFYRYLFRKSSAYQSRMKHVYKGLIVAATIPVLRGGDVAGISAFIILSFWPVFLVFYVYNRYVKSEVRRIRLFERRLRARQKLEDIVNSARQIAMN